MAGWASTSSLFQSFLDAYTSRSADASPTSRSPDGLCWCSGQRLLVLQSSTSIIQRTTHALSDISDKILNGERVALPRLGLRWRFPCAARIRIGEVMPDSRPLGSTDDFINPVQFSALAYILYSLWFLSDSFDGNQKL